MARFNDSCQLLVFYLMSCVWGFDVIIREGYLYQITLLWDQFPAHPMIFLHKLFFIIQLAYYFHMLPELYFQKVKKEDQQPKIIHAVSSFSIIALAYFFNFQRITLVLLTLHYANEVVAHVFQLIDIFDRDEKLAKLHLINKAVFMLTRFGTMVLAMLTLYYGIESSLITHVALASVFLLQSYLIFQFISNLLRTSREKLAEKHSSKRRAPKSLGEKSKKDRKKECDLPEADQNSTANKHHETKKVK